MSSWLPRSATPSDKGAPDKLPGHRRGRDRAHGWVAIEEVRLLHHGRIVQNRGTIRGDAFEDGIEDELAQVLGPTHRRDRLAGAKQGLEVALQAHGKLVRRWRRRSEVVDRIQAQNRGGFGGIGRIGSGRVGAVLQDGLTRR